MQEAIQLLRQRLDGWLFWAIVAALGCHVLMDADNQQQIDNIVLKNSKIGDLTVGLGGDLYVLLGWIVVCALAFAIVLATLDRRERLLMTIGAGVLFVGQLYTHDMSGIETTAYPWLALAALVGLMLPMIITIYKGLSRGTGLVLAWAVWVPWLAIQWTWRRVFGSRNRDRQVARPAVAVDERL